LGQDPFHSSLVRMGELVQRYLPEK
jgi:hypothetical protein